MNQVVTEYGDKIKWVYKHAPLDSLHKKARKEAEAFECAGELGGNDGFWKYADRLFEVTPSNDGLPESELLQIAADVGLNGSSFEKCLASGKYAAKVQQHLDEAITAGLRGTPYSILIAGENVIPISGAQPFEQVKSIIDSVR
jgi:protein-disulfide isomerase